MQVCQVQCGNTGLHARLLLPQRSPTSTIALIWPGSGPTDGDGNQPGLQLNNLRDLAYALVELGMASLRVDKRGVGLSQSALIEEGGLHLETYVADAVQWIDWLTSEQRFENIILLGHSEGALILSLAAQQRIVHAFFAICAPARKASDVLRSQLQGKLDADLLAYSETALLALEKGAKVPVCAKSLEALFRPSVLPYLRSWFAYDPQSEAKKLHCKVTWLWGDADAQLPGEAQYLHQGGSYRVIAGMNHTMHVPSSGQNGIAQTLVNTISNSAK